jgi:hypothetical protein
MDAMGVPRRSQLSSIKGSGDLYALRHIAESWILMVELYYGCEVTHQDSTLGRQLQ